MREKGKNRVKEGDEDILVAPAQGSGHKENRAGSALSRKSWVGERLETGREAMHSAGKH